MLVTWPHAYWCVGLHHQTAVHALHYAHIVLEGVVGVLCHCPHQVLLLNSPGLHHLPLDQEEAVLYRNRRQREREGTQEVGRVQVQRGECSVAKPKINVK
jgi:hypothetical protein